MDLNDVVKRLAGRKGSTEADIQSDVRTLLLYGGLDLDEGDLVTLEAPVGGGRRIDVEAGTTVIEVKKDLSNADVREKAAGQLAGYLTTRTEQTGQRYVGVLTDGVLWQLYNLAAGSPKLVGSLQLKSDPSATEALVVWLEGVLATAQGIRPTMIEIDRRLGAESSSFALDYADLRQIYEAHKNENAVALKRELWARLLASALGTHFQDTDELFVLHTYLVISAELIAHAAVGLPIVGWGARALLSGEQFQTAKLGGVVEADFFDWPADTQPGERYVSSLARRIARFDWSDVDHDVLKALYESVINAETRKQLGEYYTPDWLAEGMVLQTATNPLNQRVLDPACGSGTFLFWAVRNYLDAAAKEGIANKDAISGVIEHVSGIDLHPVAVALARVTYLLAIGQGRLQGDRPPFSVPVYLGDSVRWEQDETLLSKGGITIYTTDGAELIDRELHFPERVVADAARFDQLVAELADRASGRMPGSAIPKIDAILNRLAVHPDDRQDVVAAFHALCDLHDQGRDHIWGYYVRNLARPLWFTRPDNRVDVLVGNPPWLAYRFMPPHMQKTYRTLSSQRGLWAGGKVSTHQDLSDLFVVRAIEQYLRGGGAFGFVMPAAVLSRRQYDGFRRGLYEAPGAATAVKFGVPWDLRGVRPDIFPVPASVIFGSAEGKPLALPNSASTFKGQVAPRGTRWADAEGQLSVQEHAVQRGADAVRPSPYAERFFQGATILPRVLLTVDRQPPGPLGTPSGTVRVGSHRSPLEKSPWKEVGGLDGVVEERFIRPMLVGTSITPYRVVGSGLAVIPWVDGEILDGSDSRLDEYPGLAAWWRKAGEVWDANKGEKNQLTLGERLDYHRELTHQFPIQPERIVYTKSGNRISACRVPEADAVIDHTLYWASAGTIDEGRYVVAVLNSDELHERVEPLMAEGLFGKRHVDKYAFAVPFPIYDAEEPLHREIAYEAERAETVASDADVPEGASYQVARRVVRDALLDDGVTERVEELVRNLLEGSAAA